MFKLIIDLICLFAAPLIAGVSWVYCRLGPKRLPLTFRVWDMFGVSPIRHHYYQPVFDGSKLDEKVWSAPDLMSGVDWNEEEQLSLLRKFTYQRELSNIPLVKTSKQSLNFSHDNASYGPADAEMLYNMIRHFKPQRILEIGSGHSTKMAKMALDVNRQEGVVSQHICIEPFEQPWLEMLGVDHVIREKVENVRTSYFEALGENDILFIDSSHVIRAGGDVVAEYLRILPRLNKGVLIHVHDIFLPYEYPREWIVRERRFWTEQYLLQAFLAFNSTYKVIAGVNWLARNHHNELSKACPVYANQKRGHGAFWMKKIA